VKLMSVRVLSAAVAAVVLGTAAVGCSSGNSGGGGTTMPIISGLETTNVVVQDFPAIDSAGLYIAENEGLFKDEGLNVTVIPDYDDTQDTVNRIESNKAQISSGDYVTYMNDLVAPNANLEIVAEGSFLQPNVLTLMVAAGSKVTTLKQIEGKTIPISGQDDIANLLIDSVLSGNNVPIGSVHYQSNINLTQVPLLIKKNQFATGPVPQPFITVGEQAYGDSVLADTDQGATTNFPIQGYAVTKQWAQQNPNTLKAFVTALDEGQEIADTNRGDLQTALEGAPLKIPAEVADVISVPDFPTGINTARIQRVMNEMLEYHFFANKPQQLAAATAFRAANVVYTANIANANGQSNLLVG
jgi:NitT/TauT family transport system substrate-binding protein